MSKVIEVKNIKKIYKLFSSNKDRLLDTLLPGKKKRYREHNALNGVSFSVEKGECVGLIGTNGSGKSTMLKIITGVLSPTEGEVKVEGRISALLELGAGFNMEYTGMENIYLNGTMLGYSKEEIEEKIPAILEFADIGQFIDQPVKKYSSGMFVRLAFAVAINIDPEILIVDEALSVGDVFFQSKCYKKFDEFKAAGKTILFVSHDLSAITKYCDRAVLLNKGDLVAEGSPKEMINLYKKILSGGEKNSTATGVLSNSDAQADDKWKNAFTINPGVNEYGNGKASIIDFAITDANGLLTDSIIKGTDYTVKTRIHFNEEITNPIFTMSIKSIKGIELTGTNTMLERIETGTCEAGSEFIATFTQKMTLQGGEYLLSVSCTGFENGELVAYHRLYDVLNITVVSDRDTVGIFDSYTVANIEKVH